MKRIKDREINIGKHIGFFRDEMSDLGVQGNALFILWGQHVQELWGDNIHAGYLHRHYPNHVACSHYSNYGKGNTDREWVEETQKRLEVHYKLSKPKYNTLEFVRNV